jgi:hypothetical protein
MHKTLWTRGLLVATAVALMALPATAQVPQIDYLGYGWETDGFPPSNAGDVLEFVTVADYADPIFDIDLETQELTLYAYDLVSTGEVPIGGGMTMVTFVGGMMEIYADFAMNAAWGVYPPNGTVPSTFVDGTLFFQGSFNDNFTLFMDASGGGSYEGTLDGIAGEIIGDLCTDCAYTWGGAFTSGTGAQIPDGYHLQLDGEFQIDAAIANEESSWGSMKTLFRN